MTAVALRWRAEARMRWRAWLALVVLVGLLGGAAMALAAGARRTATAYDRLIEAERGLDVIAIQGGFSTHGPTPPDFLDRVAALPSVIESGRYGHVLFTHGHTADGRPVGEPDYISSSLPLDPVTFKAAQRAKLLAGRYPGPDEAEAVTIAFTIADRYGFEVGDTFTMSGVLASTVDASRRGEPWDDSARKEVTFTIAGITAAANEFPPRSLGDGAGTMLLSPAFVQAYPELVNSLRGIGVRLAPGVPYAEFRSEVESFAGMDFDALGTDFSRQYAATERAIDLLAVALWVLAGLAMAVTGLVGAQAVARSVALESAEVPVLQALGMTGGQLVGLAALRGCVVAAGSVAVSVAGAVALSPLFPFGLARVAEPSVGVSVDLVALGLGALVLSAVVVGAAAFAGWRAVRHAAPSAVRAAGARPSVLAGLAARVGLSPAAVAGVRLAQEPGAGRTAVPVRSMLTGATVAVAVLAAVGTFVASLDHLLATPRLFGWNWDMTIGDGYGPADQAEVGKALAADPDVEAFAEGTTAYLDVAGHPIVALAVTSVEGSVVPTLVEGRAAVGDDELVLGPATARRFGLAVGDVVDVAVDATVQGTPFPGAEPRRFRLVGTAILPEQSDVGLDEGALVTFRGLQALAGAEGAGIPRNIFLVRFRAGADQAAAYARVDEAVELYTVPTQQPSDLVNFGRVEHLPVVGAAVVGLAAAAMLAHVLLTSLRRRRRDLAVLRTLGFTGRQLASTVIWQSMTLCAVAVVIGLPLGVAAGRWAWTLLARQLGVLSVPVAPVLLLALAIPGAVLVANLVAVVPARLAARVRPALVLRAE